MGFFSKLFGGGKKPQQKQMPVSANPAALSVADWQSMVGKSFQIADCYDENSVEKFILIKVKLENDCPYVLMADNSGKETVFSYDETDPTHIVESIDGQTFPENKINNLFSYMSLAGTEDESETLRALRIFK